MGTSASANPTIGVTANPRVLYTDKLSKKEKKVLKFSPWLSNIFMFELLNFMLLEQSSR
jgi:hypothetical protein